MVVSDERDERGWVCIWLTRMTIDEAPRSLAGGCHVLRFFSGGSACASGSELTDSRTTGDSREAMNAFNKVYASSFYKKATIKAAT